MEQASIRFEELYKEQYEKLFRAAFRLTGNKEDTEDVIQETYLNAYRGLPGFNGKSSFSTWLYRIMLNCAYGYIRKRSKLPVQLITARDGITEEQFWESIRSNESVEESAIVDDLRETCTQIFLDCIPRKQRIAFTLKILIGLPGDEVAGIMGISEPAVKVNVHRAKQHLKDNMEGRCSFINPNSPCKCANWVKYLIDNGITGRIKVANSEKKRTYKDISIITSEADFLKKLLVLYDNQPQHMSHQEFTAKMKDIIAKGTLEILK